MSFEPTYHNLSERQPWKNEYFNQLVQDIDGALTDLTGSDLSAPFVLPLGTNIDGGYNALYGFRSWFGRTSSDTGVKDVTGFGARGNNSTDDAAAIQEAINSLPTTGGAIFFPPGRYMIGDTIRMNGTDGTFRENVTLFGCGHASRLISNGDIPDNAAMIAMNAESSREAQYQTIQGLFLDGASQGTLVDGINMASTIDASLLEVNVNDVSGDGINIGGSKTAILAQVNIWDCIRYGLSQVTGNMCERTLVRGMTIGSAGSDAIHITGARGVILGELTIKDPTGHGVYIGTQNITTTSLISIADGMIFGAEGSGMDGIRIDATTPGKDISNLIITGTMIYECDGSGIFMQGGETGSIKNFSISGATCHRNGIDGITLHKGVSHGTITGSVLTSNGSQAPSSTGNGIRIGSTDTDDPEVKQIAVTGSVCTEKHSQQRQKYGVKLNETSRDCVVVGNDVAENYAAADPLNIYNVGTDNEIAHNQGH